MRISDWSSDVCASDLGEQAGPADVGDRIHEFAVAGRPGRLGARRESNRADCDEQRTEDRANGAHHSSAPSRSEERREGKSVSVRVDLGGSRIITKNKNVKPRILHALRNKND